MEDNMDKESIYQRQDSLGKVFGGMEREKDG
jgi:hypothetical protein